MKLWLFFKYTSTFELKYLSQIKVNEFLNTAFGYKDAEILNSAIDKCLDKSEYPLIIDFSGITDYSILFFKETKKMNEE